jgi:hypothetical protein
MLQNDRYTYRVTWSEEDQEYGAYVLNFPALAGWMKIPKLH